MTPKQLLENIFCDPIDRNNFEYILKQCDKGSPRTWYWYGPGNNGKTTLMNALLKDPSIVRLPSDTESEEIYQLGDTIIRITNQFPPKAKCNIITEFKHIF